LGQNIYQGVVKVWNNMMIMMQSVNYPYVYGGAGHSNRVSIS
jgi:hypothetical protein